MKNGETELAPVSVIIPTKNRPADLRLTIQTLLEQTALPCEIIVVDQSADNLSYVAAQEEFENARTRLAMLPKLQYVHDSSLKGVSAARNHGMSIAREAYWLFLDDDVIMEREFVQELIGVYSSNDHIGGVCGVITNYPLADRALRVWTWIFARGPFLERRLPIYWKADKLRDAGLFPVSGFTGALMSFRADIARMGRFDTRIGDAEDLDFCLNLPGRPVLVITPRARLKHMRSPIGRAQELWLQRIAKTQSFLYHKNWRHNFGNRLCFAWLCFGLFAAATASGLRRFSTEPWKAALAGINAGARTAKSARS